MHWRIAVFPHAGDQQYFLGETYELSPSGAGIHCDYNLLSKSQVLLRLEIPSITKGTSNEELEISAQVVQTSLHSREGFRVGLLFEKFKDNGKALLTQVLSKRFRLG